MRRPIFRTFRLIAVLGVTMMGCGDEATNVLVVTPAGAIDVTETNGVVTAIVFASTDPFDPIVASVTAEQAAAAVAAGAGNFFRPAGCVTASASGNVVTFTLNSCLGPLGIGSVSGTVTATYVAQTNGFQVTIKSTNLTGDNASISLNVVAIFTQNGNARQAVVTNNSSATGSRGNTVAQNQMATMSWNKGDTCVTFSSTGTLQVNSASMNLANNNNLLCTARCPTGTATFSNAQNQSLTLTFNGTSTVNIKDSAGGQTTATLVCGQ